jgi:hypothetical protein
LCPQKGFEPAYLASEQSQTYALDSAATGIAHGNFNIRYRNKKHIPMDPAMHCGLLPIGSNSSSQKRRTAGGPITVA